RIQAGGVRIAFGVLQARLRQVFRFRETRGGFAVLRLAFVAVAQRRGHGAGQVLGTGARLAVIVGTAARRVHHPARARAAVSAFLLRPARMLEGARQFRRNVFALLCRMLPALGAALAVALMVHGRSPAKRPARLATTACTTASTRAPAVLPSTEGGCSAAAWLKRRAGGADCRISRTTDAAQRAACSGFPHTRSTPGGIMTVNLFDTRGTPLERQRFTWKEISQQPISKLDDDAFTRVRIILMNGIEQQANRFQHLASQMSAELRKPLAL